MNGSMDLAGVDTRRYFTAIAFFLALLFTVIGAEGATDRSAILRFAQWLLQVGVPLLILIGVHLMLSSSKTFDRLNPWFKLTASGLIGGLVFSPVALALDFLFGVDPWPGIDNIDRLSSLVLKEVAGVLPPVLLVWLGINAPRVLGLNFSRVGDLPTTSASPRAAHEKSPAPAEVNAETGFLNQVPALIGRDIVYLMAELHYLRVVTTRGQRLVLYNLRDAIDELPAETGIQTHRSYWASFAHAKRLVKRDGKVFLMMDDGHEVPVSRRQASRVKKEIAMRKPWHQPETD